jgi:hypothetical protein
MGVAGDSAGARDQLAAVLPDFERVLGPGHPDTLIVRSHLAHWTGVSGDAASARDQVAAVLPDLERALGPGHRHTLAMRRELAYWADRAAGPPAGVS